MVSSPVKKPGLFTQHEVRFSLKVFFSSLFLFLFFVLDIWVEWAVEPVSFVLNFSAFVCVTGGILQTFGAFNSYLMFKLCEKILSGPLGMAGALDKIS